MFLKFLICKQTIKKRLEILLIKLQRTKWHPRKIIISLSVTLQNKVYGINYLRFPWLPGSTLHFDFVFLFFNFISSSKVLYMFWSHSLCFPNTSQIYTSLPSHPIWCPAFLFFVFCLFETTRLICTSKVFFCVWSCTGTWLPYKERHLGKTISPSLSSYQLPTAPQIQGVFLCLTALSILGLGHPWAGRGLIRSVTTILWL